MDECYCKDLLAEAALEVALEEAEAAFEKCDIPLCVAGYSGNAVVPYTKCEQYVTCTGGVAGPTQFCDAASMIYSSAIQACNIKSLATCQADPACPPTMVPVTVVSTERPTVGSVESERPTGQKSFVNKGDTTGSVGSGSAPAPGAAPGTGAAPGAATGAGAATGGEEPSPRSTTTLDPLTMEGMIVMDAHMAANKIMLTRQLLTSPDGSRGIQSAAMGKSNDDFSYSGFTSSLQTMITTGAANSTFYIGHSTPVQNGMVYNGHVTTNDNGRVYGLVNIAAFLAMSVHDSIIHDSCNEVNTEIVNGLLPLSNACGQYGRSYQDMTCPKGDEQYDCTVDSNMEIHSNGWGGEYTKDKGFYCGSKEKYGWTGHWDYVSGTAAEPFGAENGMGRKDVEGCCWWGRGAIQLRGTCAYGKLNYFLGKRAADEGRPSMYPNIDFCLNPESICSSPTYPNLKWIVGMFRWITEVQPYHGLANDRDGVEEFHYMQRLVQFVDGGLKDWSFVHGLSGIVAQGCHTPPCYDGADLTDGAERKATFIKTLRLLGLSVKDDGVAASGRRLGENN